MVISQDDIRFLHHHIYTAFIRFWVFCHQADQVRFHIVWVPFWLALKVQQHIGIIRYQHPTRKPLIPTASQHGITLSSKAKRQRAWLISVSAPGKHFRSFIRHKHRQSRTRMADIDGELLTVKLKSDCLAHARKYREDCSYLQLIFPNNTMRNPL